MNTPKRALRPERYPVSCPHCAAVAGLPVSVKTVAAEPRALRLDFKCGACAHRWSEQFDDQLVIEVPSQAPAAV